jgi:hypothetical protein
MTNCVRARQKTLDFLLQPGIDAFGLAIARGRARPHSGSFHPALLVVCYGEDALFYFRDVAAPATSMLGQERLSSCRGITAAYHKAEKSGRRLMHVNAAASPTGDFRWISHREAAAPAASKPSFTAQAEYFCKHLVWDLIVPLSLTSKGRVGRDTTSFTFPTQG